MGASALQELPKELDVPLPSSVLRTPGESSREGQLARRQPEDKEYREVRNTDEREKNLRRNSSVFGAVAVAVLMTGLLTGAFIWRRRTAKCRE
jgi:hypothetical protein